MWPPRGGNSIEKREGGNGLVAVAIDKDKNSQTALKWATDNILHKGQTVILIHVKLRPSSYTGTRAITDPDRDLDSLVLKDDPQSKELFLPFRCFCTRKDISCKDVVLEESDVARALIDYVCLTAIETLILGASKTGFLRFKSVDIPGTVIKNAPDFCSVYVVSKGKISSTRSATRVAPFISPLIAELCQNATAKSYPSESTHREKPPIELQRKSHDETDFFRSPFARKGPNGRSYGELAVPDADISFVSSTSRPSVERIFPSFYDSDPSRGQRLSAGSEMDSVETMQMGRRSIEFNSPNSMSSFSHDSGRISNSSVEDVEAEMRRLKMELKQTMELYSSACKEALSAKQKTFELQRWKLEDEKRLEESRHSEEAAAALMQRERAKSRAAFEQAGASQRLADIESHKRISSEMKALRDTDDTKKATGAMHHRKAAVRYRKYSIEEIEAATGNFLDSQKIGEGGYGPVYKCYLDHTPVAVKVLRPDAAQGREQFNQEVEVLSCIRHPNMVLLLGACPEYGCLVYEYMSNGSLEDRLFRRGNTPTLSWQIRFKIAAEIGTGLLFLHSTKPEPLVHRDLKPGNILLDRNFVSKISDVGLARLVPPSVADSVTQYRMTSTAGTFCYIDPEYQQTGMLGTKSDIYSLGIIYLQLLTARPAMGLTHYVERAVEQGTLREMLDPTVHDWPVEEALSLAKLALQCAELRRKDRPDLGKVIMPELNRLRNLAEEYSYPVFYRASPTGSPHNSHFPLQTESTELSQEP